MTDPQTNGRHRILVVDDEEKNRRMLSDMIKSLGHDCETASDGFEALAILKMGFDLVLLDVSMPGIDGYEVTRLIRRNPEYGDVPVIIVTALVSKADRLRAAEAGANDFIGKPVDRIELRVRMATLLKMKEAQDVIKHHKAILEKTVEERTAALREALQAMTLAQHEAYDAHLETVRRLALAAEYRDDHTGAHIIRVTRYSGMIAHMMSLPPGEIEIVTHASAMHDMGKIAIPDGILLKPGKLTEDEWHMMRRHPIIGARILGGSESKLLKAGETISMSHHEKWDGSGYPHGLMGNEIHLYGRIVAVADVYDALTTERPYKPAFPPAQAFEMIHNGAGKHFDPEIVKAFLSEKDKVLKIQTGENGQKTI